MVKSAKQVFSTSCNIQASASPRASLPKGDSAHPFNHRAFWHLIFHEWHCNIKILTLKAYDSGVSWKPRVQLWEASDGEGGTLSSCLITINKGRMHGNRDSMFGCQAGRERQDKAKLGCWIQTLFSPLKPWTHSAFLLHTVSKPYLRVSCTYFSISGNSAY